VVVAGQIDVLPAQWRQIGQITRCRMITLPFEVIRQAGPCGMTCFDLGWSGSSEIGPASICYGCNRCRYRSFKCTIGQDRPVRRPSGRNNADIRTGVSES
jgi:hypothetical protein